MSVVVLRQVLHTFSVEHPGQKTFLHGTVCYDTNLVGGAEGEELVFRVPVQHAVGGLKRRHRMNGVQTFELGCIEVRDSGVADLALCDYIGDRRPGLFNSLIGLGPVNLVQIDHLDSEARKAGVHFLENRPGIQVWKDRLFIVPSPSALRGYDRSLSDGYFLQRPAQYLFRMAQPVDRRCIYPVDPQLERAAYRCHGIDVVLRSPSETPIPASLGPAAKTHRGKLKIRRSERPCLHFILLIRLRW